MKKQFTGFILGVLVTVLIMGLGLTAYAESYKKTIEVEVNAVKVIANGTEITEDTLLWNNKTYIPLRAVCEAADCLVRWNNHTKTASVMNRYTAGELSTITINGLEIPASQIRGYLADDPENSKIYIDAEFLAEFMDYGHVYTEVSGRRVFNMFTEEYLHYPNTDFPKFRVSEPDYIEIDREEGISVYRYNMNNVDKESILEYMDFLSMCGYETTTIGDGWTDYYNDNDTLSVAIMTNASTQGRYFTVFISHG